MGEGGDGGEVGQTAEKPCGARLETRQQAEQKKHTHPRKKEKSCDFIDIGLGGGGKGEGGSSEKRGVEDKDQNKSSRWKLIKECGSLDE